jgi:hypothetical protein
LIDSSKLIRLRLLPFGIGVDDGDDSSSVGEGVEEEEYFCSCSGEEWIGNTKNTFVTNIQRKTNVNSVKEDVESFILPRYTQAPSSI